MAFSHPDDEIASRISRVLWLSSTMNNPRIIRKEIIRFWQCSILVR
jgi:hypothetical protein